MESGEILFYSKEEAGLSIKSLIIKNEVNRI